MPRAGLDGVRRIAGVGFPGQRPVQDGGAGRDARQDEEGGACQQISSA